MSDAFDQWVEWCSKPLGDRRGIPAELYAAVMSLPEADHSDRQRVNEAIRHHKRLAAREEPFGSTSTITRTAERTRQASPDG